MQDELAGLEPSGLFPLKIVAKIYVRTCVRRKQRFSPDGLTIRPKAPGAGGILVAEGPIVRPPGKMEGPPRRKAGRIPAGGGKDCGFVAPASNKRISVGARGRLRVGRAPLHHTKTR